MIRRTTWVVLVLFAIMVAFTVFLQRSKQATAPTPTFTPSSRPLFNLGDDKVVRLHISSSDGKVLILERGSDINWTLIEPSLGEADSEKVQTAISQWLSTRILSTPAIQASLEQLGLQPPLYAISAKLEKGGNILQNVGKGTPTGSGYYLLTGDQTIIIVNKSGVDALIALLDLPPIKPTPIPTLTPETPQSSETPQEVLTPSPEAPTNSTPMP